SAHHTSGPLVYGGDYWLPVVTTFLLWVLGISVSLGYYQIQAWSEVARGESGRFPSAGTAGPRAYGEPGPQEPTRRTTLVRKRRLFVLVTVLVCGLAITYHAAGTNARALLL